MTNDIDNNFLVIYNSYMKLYMKRRGIDAATVCFMPVTVLCR